MTEPNKASRTVAELIKELQQFPPDMLGCGEWL